SRHELADVYKRNCAIYLTRADLVMQGDLFGAVSRAHVMPAERSVDINTPFDFLIAETVVRQAISYK
ncbi:MAG: acylneuraminate cytidylyltransferase family protein, partial [Patescibacteria group bacterium]